MALLPVLLGWPLVLLPLHIVLLELIIDPACSIVFEAEPEEPDVMRRPPRDPEAPLFRMPAVIRAILQGLVALAATTGVLAFALHRGYGDARSRALAFAMIVLANLGLIVALRSESASALASLRVRNRALGWVLAAALAMLVLGFAAAPVRAVLRFDLPARGDFLVLGIAAAVALIGFDVLKERRPRMKAR
jgi:Ca2+-transporting ATPase